MEEHVNIMNTEGFQNKFYVINMSTKVNWTSNEEMGGKNTIVTGHLA
jgi:hypothetical protein